MKTAFVSAHQQAGDFQVVIRDGKVVQKNGGNVASYFCTPDGRVVNAVLGPVGADTLLQEARWAIDIYEDIESSGVSEAKERLAAAHSKAAQQGGNQQSRRLHAFLADRPLVGLDEIYRPVFRNLLGEGRRADAIESPEVLALEGENQRLRREVRQRSERVDGAGSAKVLNLQEQNGRLEEQAERLAEIERAQNRHAAQATNWLRVAVTYLKTGDPEDEEAAEIRLKLILKRYPNTKAAEKAAELLARLRGTGLDAGK